MTPLESPAVTPAARAKSSIVDDRSCLSNMCVEFPQPAFVIARANSPRRQWQVKVSNGKARYAVVAFADFNFSRANFTLPAITAAEARNTT